MAQGFDGLAVREPGDVFEFSGAPADWFEYIDEKEKAAAEEEYAMLMVEARHRAEIEAQVRLEQENARVAKLAADDERLRAAVEAKIRTEMGASAPAEERVI